MYFAQIRFGTLPSGVRQEEMERLALDYHGSLHNGGQVHACRFLAWTDGRLVLHVLVPRPDAILEQYHTAWGLERLRSIREKLGRSPELVVTDDDLPKRFPRPQGAPFLVVQVGGWGRGEAPPIRRGTDGVPFATYLFPLDQSVKQDFHLWADAYACHIEMWIRSRHLELPAWRQMVEPTSDLSKEGRKHCAEIENASGIPTYYFLDRYWAMSAGESERRCPGCGGRWRLAEPYLGRTHRWEIAFLCRKCRLVSANACSEGTKREASIGYRAAP